MHPSRVQIELVQQQSSKSVVLSLLGCSIVAIFRGLPLPHKQSCGLPLSVSLHSGVGRGSGDPRTCVQAVWLPVQQKSIMHNESIVR